MSFLTRNVLLLRRFSYQSAISLGNLYPNSSLKITTPVKPSFSSTGTKFDGFIPIDKLDITYSRSSGPGGQNVNTVNTKVDVRFHVNSAQWLDQDIREKILEKNKTKINKEGYLIMKSELTRSQQLNLADVLSKLREIIHEAAKPEPKMSEETIQTIQRRIARSNRERLFVKRQRSDTKNSRQAPTVNEL